MRSFRPDKPLVLARDKSLIEAELNSQIARGDELLKESLTEPDVVHLVELRRRVEKWRTECEAVLMRAFTTKEIVANYRVRTAAVSGFLLMSAKKRRARLERTIEDSTGFLREIRERLDFYGTPKSVPQQEDHLTPMPMPHRTANSHGLPWWVAFTLEVIVAVGALLLLPSSDSVAAILITTALVLGAFLWRQRGSVRLTNSNVASVAIWVCLVGLIAAGAFIHFNRPLDSQSVLTRSPDLTPKSATPSAAPSPSPSAITVDSKFIPPDESEIFLVGALKVSIGEYTLSSPASFSNVYITLLSDGTQCGPYRVTNGQQFIVGTKNGYRVQIDSLSVSGVSVTATLTTPPASPCPSSSS